MRQVPGHKEDPDDYAGGGCLGPQEMNTQTYGCLRAKSTVEIPNPDEVQSSVDRTEEEAVAESEVSKRSRTDCWTND